MGFNSAYIVARRLYDHGGDLPAAIEVTEDAEFEELAIEFKRLADKVEDLQQRLSRITEIASQEG